MDVGGSAFMGEHALSYVVAVYAAQALRVRVLKFRLHEQAAHVLAFLFIERMVAGLVGLVVGESFAGPRTLVAPVVAAILWMPLCWLLFHRIVRGERRTFS
jgi:rod shape-determining protein MreD